MKKVSRENPCPICGKPDWCLIDKEGKAAICPRIAQGSIKRCGQAGWLHILDDDYKPSAPEKRPVRPVDWAGMQESAVQYLTWERQKALARQWDVDASVITALHTGWLMESYSFPMHRYDGKICGFRLRHQNNNKTGVKGSRNGIFIPKGVTPNNAEYICEGNSDLAILKQLGLRGIARPGCNSCLEWTTEWLMGREKPVVIVADNDENQVGLKWAQVLRELLIDQLGIRVTLLLPPRKYNDIRGWWQHKKNRKNLKKFLTRL